MVKLNHHGSQTKKSVKILKCPYDDFQFANFAIHDFIIFRHFYFLPCPFLSTAGWSHCSTISSVAAPFSSTISYPFSSFTPLFFFSPSSFPQPHYHGGSSDSITQNSFYAWHHLPLFGFSKSRVWSTKNTAQKRSYHRTATWKRSNRRTAAQRCSNLPPEPKWKLQEGMRVKVW